MFTFATNIIRKHLFSFKYETFNIICNNTLCLSFSDNKAFCTTGR